MNTNDISLPDQVHDPDWSEVRYYADRLLEQKCKGGDDDYRDRDGYEAALVEEVLRALYGPKVDGFIRELRKRYGHED